MGKIFVLSVTDHEEYILSRIMEIIAAEPGFDHIVSSHPCNTLEALQKLNERERQIFLARTLEEEDFETLGLKFGLSYKGAAALYYRTIQKIRKCIEGGDKK